MRTSRNPILRNRKRRIEYRLRQRDWPDQDKPMFTARHIRYELAEKARGLGTGGIGAMHLLDCRTGLIEARHDEPQNGFWREVSARGSLLHRPHYSAGLFAC